MITPFHVKYYANELFRKKPNGSDDRISSSLFDAALEINPHQIDAALFAFQSPLSKGVLLADEVGLGKTIEAGLVMCQLWAERKRRQIVICPAALRKQWSLELSEKFNLPSIILETRTYNDYLKSGMLNPMLQDSIIIMSYNYASKMNIEVGAVPWNVVVIDEAHKLRNCYRPSNKLGQNIRTAVQGRWKLLLTATPLQNNLTELYGLASMIDDHIFGDIKSFRDNYINNDNTEDLKYRLASFCKRTLRKDVLEYVKYTERFPIVKEFVASDQEQALYNGISEFLQCDCTYAIPYKQKQLTTLVIRKVLASSTWAILQTLRTILKRLEDLKDGIITPDSDIEGLVDEDEADVIDEEMDEIGDSDTTSETEKIDIDELDYEITKIREFISLAESIHIDTKSTTLLDALRIGFEETTKRGGNRKALIFTESKRTQEYLSRFLEANGYKGKIAIFNGSNSGKANAEIYKAWCKKNKFTGRISGSPTADKRNAIIEYFRDEAEIMIATESAAEGVNLQFCSLVINYDLPWNPQRIEQRIGRCHRYGQKNDVVVVNFINSRNYADVRVHELLDEKFNLFRGVLGSSDEVLGTVESGVDFEQKILEIYQQCRTPEEIEAQFDKLQKEMESKIKKAMKKTRDALFENFDADVHERLKLSVTEYLNRYMRYFWALTQYELNGKADFNDKDKTFMLHGNIGTSPSGKYALIMKGADNRTGTLYRMNHPLGQYVLSQAAHEPETTGQITFDITHHHGYKISQVEQLKGRHGYLCLYKYTIHSFEHEDYMLFAGTLEDGTMLTPEQCQKLFDCEGTYDQFDILQSAKDRLKAEINQYADGTLAQADERNLTYFKEEEDRLEKWTDDLVNNLEKELSNVKRAIQENERKLRTATSIAEHLEIEQTLQVLNKRKRNMRAKLEENEDALMEKRNTLINDIKKRMKTSTELDELFTVAWKVV